MRRGSAPLGHLLESFDSLTGARTLQIPTAGLSEGLGAISFPRLGHLVPLPWMKVLGAVASAAQGLCLYRVPELNKSSLPMWVG